MGPLLYHHCTVQFSFLFSSSESKNFLPGYENHRIFPSHVFNEILSGYKEHRLNHHINEYILESQYKVHLQLRN